ncbi:hypothetical protein [Ensifer sp. SL37]|uniref:hypothetical protein n=1 Tax=Ensifer sp. SL37 TaxID=2995137 RepID=UPI00227355BC|nr:hypothetical protein [Ensifer sp. SL37]MCY1741164.1 hypothetical protein [Ensifer sp. SL37]
MGAPVTWVIPNPVNGADQLAGTTANPLVVSQSTASQAASAGVYSRAAAVSATPGQGVLVSNVTTAGTVTLTLSGGGTVTITVPLGSTILPFAVTAAALGTAVGGTFQSLFFV